MKIKLLLLMFTSIILSETLKYDVDFSGVKAGESTLSFKKEKKGKSVFYNLVSTTRTNKKFSKFVNFKEKISITLDTLDYSIKKIQKQTAQGKSRKSFRSVVRYDSKTDSTTASSSNKTLKIAGKVHNPFGIIYYLRNQDIKLSDVFRFTTYDNDKKRDLEIIARRIEAIRVPHGTYECIVIEPVGKLSKGAIRIWLDTITKIPIQIEVKNKVGTLKMMLKSIAS